MNARTSLAFVTCLMACFALGARAAAGTVATLGVGTAVTSVDRMATFDSMTSQNAINLDTYTENKLSITTASTSWGEDPTLATLDPFHLPGGPDGGFYAMANGSDTWVTIEATDATKIFGVEFTYGNTWTTGQISGPYPWGNDSAILEWQTFVGGNVVSSGTIGGSPFLEMGTIVGFSDPAGFDQLQVQATIAGASPANAIALDNLKVQLSPSPAPIPEPSTFVICSMLLGAFSGIALRKRMKTTTAASLLRRCDQPQPAAQPCATSWIDSGNRVEIYIP